MDSELKALEDKVGHIVEMCQRLRADNQELREQLATAINQHAQLKEKVKTAAARLEMLLSQIPSDDNA